MVLSSMLSSKYPVLTLLSKITVLQLFLIILVAFWMPPDSGAELGHAFVMLFLFCLDGIIAIIYFFLRKEIIWKAWLILSFVSPFLYLLIDAICTVKY